jgi:hypothetical protein
MVETRYHSSINGVISSEDLFEDKEVPLIDLRDIGFHPKCNYLLSVGQNASSVNPGYFGFNSRKKEYFFRTKDGRRLPFTNANFLTRVLVEGKLIFEGSNKIILERECLNKIIEYKDEAVPGADVFDLTALKREAQHRYKGIIKLS